VDEDRSTTVYRDDPYQQYTVENAGPEDEGHIIITLPRRPGGQPVDPDDIFVNLPGDDWSYEISEEPDENGNIIVTIIPPGPPPVTVVDVDVEFRVGRGGSFEGGEREPIISTFQTGSILAGGDIPRLVAATGYEFIGWTIGRGGRQPGEPVGHEIEGAVTFTARFDRIQHPVTFDATMVGWFSNNQTTITIMVPHNTQITTEMLEDLLMALPSTHVHVGWTEGTSTTMVAPAGQRVTGSRNFRALVLVFQEN
jgi:hypothetical protein